MQVKIKDTIQELIVHTVSIVPEKDTLSVRLFHCIHCGNGIFQHSGRVAKIYPILEPSNQELHISECKQCHNKYNFQTHLYYDPELVEVILAGDLQQQPNFFHCFNHRRPALITYTHEHVYKNASKQLTDFPFRETCPHCQQEFLFTGIM